MKTYIGKYKNGRARVFSSAKKITKERFPFYVQVIGPFEDKEEAGEFFKKKKFKAVAVAGKKKTKVKVTVKNPGLKWHREKATLAAAKLIRAVKEKNKKARHFAEGLSYAHEESIEEELLGSKRRNPVSLTEKRLVELERILRGLDSEYEGLNDPEYNKKYVESAQKKLIILMNKYRREQSSLKVDKTKKISPRLFAIDKARQYHNPVGNITNIKRLASRRNRLIERLSSARTIVDKKKLMAQINSLNIKLERTMYPNPLGAALMIAGNPARSLLGKNPKISRDLAPEYNEVSNEIGVYETLLQDYRYSGKGKTRLKKELKELKRKETILFNKIQKQKIHKKKKKNPGSKETEIYQHIIAIEAQKGPKGEFPNEYFRHDFKRGSKVIGLPDGDILITNGKGKNLWKNFKY